MFLNICTAVAVCPATCSNPFAFSHGISLVFKDAVHGAHVGGNGLAAGFGCCCTVADAVVKRDSSSSVNPAMADWMS
ncbi:hypothetical protein [Escherichia coli]|uniref:hypothetical protein n=1 Tax=Escherichia coli TaxID=562 RepID=UPI002FCD2979